MTLVLTESHVTAHYTCDHDGCSETVKSDRWSASRAGWFVTKDQRSWCAEHIPEWVSTWRQRKKGQ